MRVHQVTKSRSSDLRCGRCNTLIAKGSPYCWTKARYGAKRVRCTAAACRFRDSDLAGGKLSQVYEARETAEDAITSWDGEDSEELRDALHEAAETIREIAAEYEESASNIRRCFSDSPTADECEEKASELGSWADELESAADNFDDKPEVCEHEEVTDRCTKCGWKDLVADAGGDPSCSHVTVQHCLECKCDLTDEEGEDALATWQESCRDAALEAVSACPL